MQKVIFIDLDGTLTVQSTWFLLNQKLGITPEEDHHLFTQYIKNNINYEAWITDLVALYKSRGIISKKEIKELAVEIPLRADAIATIAALKEKGYTIVVLSGSVDTIVQILARNVGADDWRCCSKLIFDEKDILVDIIASGDEAPTKKLLAQEYAKENNLNLSECFAIDDGGNGIELFKCTKGILLGTNESLLPVAWKQVQSLSEIPPLL